ncbi:hypothetical protein DB41_JQ00010, partial [Neochlamydia sp. TUME1]
MRRLQAVVLYLMLAIFTFCLAESPGILQSYLSSIILNQKSYRLRLTLLFIITRAALVSETISQCGAKQSLYTEESLLLSMA